MRAIWKGAVLAERAQTFLVEGNRDFPRESLHRDPFRDRDSLTRSSR